MLLCGIQDIFNACIIDGKSSAYLNKTLFIYFNNLIKAFVNTWIKQEEERKLKKEEEESLYKTKTKCQYNEEDEINKAFKELFPNYHDKDFGDLQQKDLSNDDENDSLIETTEYKGLINYEDVQFVADLHAKFVCNYTKSEWLNPSPKNLKLNFIQPLLQKYQLFKLLFNKTLDCLNYTIDSELLGSMNILSTIAENYGELNAFGKFLSVDSNCY